MSQVDEIIDAANWKNTIYTRAYVRVSYVILYGVIYPIVIVKRLFKK